MGSGVCAVRTFQHRYISDIPQDAFPEWLEHESGIGKKVYGAFDGEDQDYRLGGEPFVCIHCHSVFVFTMDDDTEE